VLNTKPGTNCEELALQLNDVINGFISHFFENALDGETLRGMLGHKVVTHRKRIYIGLWADLDDSVFKPLRGALHFLKSVLNTPVDQTVNFNMKSDAPWESAYNSTEPVLLPLIKSGFHLDFRTTHWYKLIQVLGLQETRCTNEFPKKFLGLLLLRNAKVDLQFSSIDKLPGETIARILRSMPSGVAIKAMVSGLTETLGRDNACAARFKELALNSFVGQMEIIGRYRHLGLHIETQFDVLSKFFE
jgi:hypothetical protein